MKWNEMIHSEIHTAVYNMMELPQQEISTGMVILLQSRPRSCQGSLFICMLRS